jgi:hypothetical protein
MRAIYGSNASWRGRNGSLYLDAWCQQCWYDPSLRGLRIEFAYQCGPHGLNMRAQLGVYL